MRLPDLLTSFQPIADLHEGGVFGYEALSACPDAGGVRALFERARSDGWEEALDLFCWETSLRRFCEADPPEDGSLLFVNVAPGTVASGELQRRAPGLLEELDLPAERVVLEITEGTRIDDYRQFGRSLALLEDLGFCTALDDAGSGHAGLQSLAELQPRFVKIDRTLVDGLAGDGILLSVVEAFLLLESRLGCTVVAEGIEQAEDLLAARELGVRLGQGYFVGRPTPRPGGPDAAFLVALEEAPERASLVDLERRARRRGPPRSAPRPTHSTRSGVTIGSIAEPAPVLQRGAAVREAVRLFEDSAASCVPILARERPVGLLEREHLYRLLGHQYGHALYLRRAVEEVAEKHPLTVEAETPLEDASRLAMARGGGRVYHDVVVTRGGLYVGVVSIRRILDLMTELQLRAARYANPLTGLPGNPAIEREIRQRMEEGGGLGVLYLDLDNFKAFNDHYGFHRGDDALRLVARIASEVAGTGVEEEVFVGHIGGDDFVLLLGQDDAERVGGELVRRFDEGVGSLYEPADRERGWVETPGRDGNVKRFPLMTLTVAGATADAGTHYAALLDGLSEVKQYAKARARSDTGRSTLMLDRRGDRTEPAPTAPAGR